ncbi:MAG: AAA family ATPase [Steroidobacteraceae bacterium]
MRPSERTLEDMARGGLKEKHFRQYGFMERSAVYMRNLTGLRGISGAYEIPYPEKNFSRFRLHDPYEYIKNGKRRKMRYWQPSDVSTPLYVPRGVTLGSGIVVCEGEKKAIKAVTCGIQAVAVGGVNNIKENGQILPELHRLAYSGATIYVVFDGDARTKPQVAKAEKKLARELTDIGAKVILVRLPAGVAFDDYLNVHSKKGFDALPRELFEASALEGLTFSKRPPEVLTKTPQPTDFIVDPLVEAGTLVFFAGTGGVGKGMNMLSLAVHMAAATLYPCHGWLGFKVKPGKVVILAMEDSLAKIDKRLHYIVKRYCDEHKISGVAKKELYAAVLENVRYESLDDRELRVIVEQERNIVRTKDLDRLARLLSPLKPELIIVDPLSQLHTLNENDNNVGSALAGALRQLCKHVGAAVLVPAHTSKDADRRAADNAAALRGASALSTAGRSVFMLREFSAKEASEKLAVEYYEAHRRFGQLTHVKTNDIWADPKFIERFAHGVWDVTEVPERKVSEGEWVLKLRGILADLPGKCISKRALTTKQRKEVFGAVGEQRAKTLVDAAIRDEVLLALTKEELDALPKGAKQGGSIRLKLAEVDQ